MNEEHIRTLLRQRDVDQMPKGYLDSLLPRLHQTQRQQMLRRSLWQIATERIGTFWSEHSTSRGAYAFAVAAVFVFGAGVIFSFKPRFPEGFHSGHSDELAAAQKGKPRKASRIQEASSADNAPTGVSPIETQPVSFGKQKE